MRHIIIVLSALLVLTLEGYAQKGDTEGPKLVEAPAITYSTVEYAVKYLELDSIENIERLTIESDLRAKRLQRVKNPDRTLHLSFNNHSKMSAKEFRNQVKAQVELLSEDFSVNAELHNRLLDAELVRNKQQLIKFVTKGDNYKPNERKWEDWKSFTNERKDKGLVNIYVVSDLPKELGHGYAKYGWVDRPGPDIVIRAEDFGKGKAPFDQGKVLTHLLGNYLGLLPLSGLAPCGDDGIRDTPIHNEPLYLCGEIELMSSCDNELVLMDNFMSHTADACKSNFTDGQWKRMLRVLDIINQKNKR